ncbi:hybrid sensor histidine kinase/response regulator [Pseudobdellovibrio exovorus]|uniref:histidine kinase n=1 Tax=Pseudobdellovibrio exovorus JSS TaxID=1184267 RepID=M4V8W1_9BACT|nr:ATP-binding protein [Pseudobdellovibrio exovorus]AGH95653.1 hypothetical protein A11Q_1437 [Pseudobdellovibrio exovorus JSS]
MKTLKSITREFYRSQNLVLNNSILRIQSFSEISSLVRSNNRHARDVVSQIVSSTMFQRATLYSLTDRSGADKLPVLKRIRTFKTANDSLPDTKSPDMSSSFLRRKIKKMLDENLLNTVAVSYTENSNSIAFISRASSNRRDFIVFQSSLQDFLKDWPNDRELVAIIKDSQTNFEVLVRQDKDHQFQFVTTPQAISEAQHKNKFLIYSHYLVNESYGISIDWFQNTNNRPSNYVLMIAFFGFSISLLTALFLGFILDQNKRIYKLVISRTEELELAMNQAQEANLAKTRFLANMSHELRTPLNLILGMVELLQNTNQDRKAREYLKNMQTAGEHLLNLITDLLSMSKEEASDVEINQAPISIPTFFEEIGRIIGPECRKKNLDFYMNISQEIPMSLVGDPVKIRQILLNLLRNSLKYTHTGSVSLEVEVLQREVSMDGLFHLRFHVHDTGVGIPTSKMNLIFDRFFQIEGSKMLAEGGVGLGLSIVKDLVSKMHGNITVKSEVGQGSTFTVDLDLETRQPDPWIQQYQLDKPLINRLAVVTDNADSFNVINSILPTHVLTISHYPEKLFLDLNTDEKNNLKAFDQIILFRVKKETTEYLFKSYPDKKIILIGHDLDLTSEIRSSKQVHIMGDTPIMHSQLFDALDFRSSKKKDSALISVESTEPSKTTAFPKNQVLSILVVDDDAGNRELLRAYLESPNFKVSFAKDGQEAFELFQNNLTDVVIADLRMPIMNGFELAEAIRHYENKTSQRTPTPVILLTADALESTSNEAKKYAIHVFLTKPIRRSKLLNAIYDVTQNRNTSNA